jgi:membrane-associated protease RseP (regulator of RpoE activity)
MSALLIAAGLIAAWIAALYLLNRRGLLAKWHMSLMGPFLMWRTTRGRVLIDRIARRKRFWRAYGDLSTGLVAVTMAGITALLVWSAVRAVDIPAERAPTPELLLGIPGVNPIIPLGYGIFGLAVAIVLHEFAHGIAARAAKVPMALRSLGVLLFVVPVGAFVEPDEDQLRAATKRERARVFSVGPATNLLLALLFAFLFSAVVMASVQPAVPGVVIMGFTSEDAPAKVAGLQEGVVITAVDGAAVTDLRSFRVLMAAKLPGDTVTLSATGPEGRDGTYAVTLIQDPSAEGIRAILGVFVYDLSMAYFHPIGGSEYFGGLVNSGLVYISLPFGQRAPIPDTVLPYYEISGPFAALPPAAFWLMANALYWLFWLNLMLGATNALPAVPLDGGYVFRDGIDGLLERVRGGMNAEARQRAVHVITVSVALVILSLVLWQIIGPRLLNA